MSQFVRYELLFRNVVIILAFTASLCLVRCLPVAIAGEIYSFVDEEGVIHFSNAPSDPRYSVAEQGEEIGYARSGARHYKYGYRRSRFLCKERDCIKSPELSRLVYETARRHGVDPDLLKAIIEVESGGRPGARSHKGAVGLMQLMPETAAEVGVKDRTDSHQNIQGGTIYFRTLLERFGGNVVLALAAYNAGPASVEKYKGIPPYLETVRYVRKVLEAWNRYRDGTSSRK